MKKNHISFIILLFIGLSNSVYGHCQVPCGIYDDAVRIVQLEEDISTVRKAMSMIKGLSGKSDAQSLNQLIRWVNTKETHASNIQETVSSYFLAQRIKPKKKGESGRQQYVNQTLLLQQLIVAAMKCKQNVDQSKCDAVTDLIDEFSVSYFDEHGMEHLKEVQNKK
jgi:nickel superoxide dismutase|tara:strand:- start:50 stop:547 length:498 start_codon:yes stop_codon:yes gene_type:complete